jgi:hypothetical protein
MPSRVTRRTFLTATGAAAALTRTGPTVFARAADEPALLGGPAVRQAPFPSWPLSDETERDALVQVLQSGH